MPRDGSGVYTLPAGNPVVTNTLIQSTWANPTMSDIAVQLNNVLTRDGLLGPVSTFKLVDGAVATPGLGFNSEPGLGIFRSSAGIVNFAASSGLTALIDASSSAITRLGVYPRAVTSSAQLLLSNQPSGTTNRVDSTITQSATGLAFASSPNGTGTSQPFSFTTSGLQSGFQLVDTGASGANLKFTGDGATTPSKTIRVRAGNMEWMNNAYGAVVLTLSDTGNLTAAGNVTAYSDLRLKEDVEMSLGALGRLRQLHGYTYTKDGQRQYGLIAQEVINVYPELVQENPDGYMSVNYMGFIGELIEAVKELSRDR